MLLVDVNGKKRGIVSLREALEVAKESSLDLVQVSPSNADPVVCKILDYGKHLFSKKKTPQVQGQKLKKYNKRN